MLNLRQLETFVAVVENHGFHEAAQRLGCSQPTISQQLRKLEDTLGVKLVSRDRVNVAPTVEGARLLPLARSILGAAVRTHDVIAGRTVTVGASSNIGIYLLQPFIARYARAYGPGNSIGLQIADNPEVARRLSSGEFDLAVMEWWDGRPGFAATRWRQEKMVVITHPEHRWARRKSLPPEWLFEESLIGGEAGTGTGTLLRKVFGKNASKMKVTMTLGSTEAVKAAVKAGLGVSLVFASAVADEARLGSLRTLPVSGTPIVKDLFIVLPEDTPADAPVRRFTDLLMEKVGHPATNGKTRNGRTGNGAAGPARTARSGPSKRP
jgi:DNA-binding transcriptional LysR family regulator